jgi:hypothetical protein
MIHPQPQQPPTDDTPVGITKQASATAQAKDNEDEHEHEQKASKETAIRQVE